ncbi:hypothetical protein GF337_18130 [candidate division KSB1 bacterium]|nr:hypothetical protein [candidate division KSB1 bacterium]
MKAVFTEKAIKEIADILCASLKHRQNNYRLVVKDEEENRSLSLEIYPDIPIGNRTGNLISVYTGTSHLQLHFCTGYVVSKMLGEVTFIGQCGGTVSGLIVEKEAGCSLYANVDNSLLSGDFTQMGPEVMMCGIALSLTEHILPED